MKLRPIKTKEQARDFAIERQERASNENLSYMEIIFRQSYFGNLGVVYGLCDEYFENGIL